MISDVDESEIKAIKEQIIRVEALNNITVSQFYSLQAARLSLESIRDD